MDSQNHRRDIHRRLAHRWRIAADLNQKGTTLLERALAANPSTALRQHLEFQNRTVHAYQPLMQALTEYHSARYAQYTGGNPKAELQRAARFAAGADRLARVSFPNPLDPAGSEIGTLPALAPRLIEAVAAAEKN